MVSYSGEKIIVKGREGDIIKSLSRRTLGNFFFHDKEVITQLFLA